MKKTELLALALVLFVWAFYATPANAEPISAAIVSALALTGTAAVVATAVITFALNAVASLAVAKLFGKKRRDIGSRQASIMELSIGESDCELLLGRVATGGALIDAFNHGNDYEWETLVIALADHELDAIEGYWIGDDYFEWRGAGYDARFNEDGNPSKPRLYLQQFYNWGVTPWWLESNAPERWGATDHVTYRHCLIFAYHVSEKIWPAGRPSIRVKVRGKRLYNPAKDSTVSGGSGSHRYGVESTYEWDDNAAVAYYNWKRGLWANGILLVGPGRTADEAPPENVIPDIAVCNEAVTLKAGGTERRWTVGAVIRSSDPWIDTLRSFAESMGGDIVDRDGAVAAEAGRARSVSATFTDLDLATGKELRYKGRVGRDSLVNIITTRFVSPEQMFQVASAPVRRSSVDITTDGEPREKALELEFVTSKTQAQRVGEIERKRSRLQARAVVTLWQKFIPLESGDWVTWTSDRFFSGGSKTFRVVRADIDGGGLVTLTLEEINTAVYSWTAASDELDDERPVYLPAGAPTAAAILGFSAEMIAATGAANTRPVAMRVRWDADAARRDSRISSIKIQYRIEGSPFASSYIVENEDSGEEVLPPSLFIDGVNYEARATPIATGPTPLSTAWREVEPLNRLPATPPALTTFDAYQITDGTRFSAAYAGQWPVALDLEIRAGAFPETGRTIYRGAPLTTPLLRDPPPADGSNRYWAALVVTYAGGRIYGPWRFRDLDVAILPNRNVVESFDFQDGDWPGVARGFTRTGVSGSQILAMDAIAGVRPPYADYFQTVDLGANVNARWFFSSLVAGRDPSPSIAYADLADLSYYDLTAWFPYAVAEPVSEARVYPRIATDTPREGLIDGATLDSTSATVNGTAAAIFDGVSYADARTGKGASVSASSAIAWPFAIPATFRVVLEIAPASAWSADRVLWKATNAGGDWMRVRYDDADGLLYFEDSAGGFVSVAAPIWEAGEIYALSISQEGTERRIAWAIDGGAPVIATAAAAASPAMTRAYLAGAGAISYEELQNYTYAELAALSVDDLSGANLNAAGVVANFEAFDSPLTDDLAADLLLRGPAGFSYYRPFDPADYIAGRASIWLRLEVESGYGEPVRVDSAQITVDVEDVRRSGSADILAAGTRINYGVTYHETPDIVATLIAGATAASIRITGRDLTGFTATAYNTSGVAVDASISWASLGW
jgi:hypothetical protein